MAIISRPKYVGTTLPAVSETVVLYATPVMGTLATPGTSSTPSNFFEQNNIQKVVLDLVIDQTGTITQQISSDGGTTWVTIYSEALAINSSNSHHREFPVAGFQDYRIRFANNATAQTTFIVNMALSDLAINPGAQGLSGSGAAQAAADGMANPTEDGTLAYMLGFNGTTWDRIKTAIVAKTATFTGILNTLTLGRYNLSPPALTDGDVQLLQLDASGNLRNAEQLAPGAEDNTNNVIAVQVKPIAASTYAPSQITSVGAATTATPKASAGNLLSISAANRNGAVRYLQLYNTTAATTPVLFQFVIPPGSQIIVGTDFWTTAGFNFSTGITWGVSTTAGSYVAATASETDVFGAYI